MTEKEQNTIRILEEEIKQLNNNIKSINMEKRRIEEEKNNEIKRLLTEIEELRTKLNNEQAEKENGRQLMPNNDGINVENANGKIRVFESNLIKVVSEYKTAINSITTNKDLFLQNAVIEKLILAMKHKYGDLINSILEQNILQKMKFLEDELEVSKNEIKTLHDTVNMQKVLINDYKDRLTESLKKMNEILVFADNKNMNEKTLKEKLKSSSQQYDYEITSANQKYKEENKRRLDIGRSLDNLKLFLNNILKNENKELNVKVPDDERELMLKVKYYIDSLKH